MKSVKTRAIYSSDTLGLEAGEKEKLDKVLYIDIIIS
jgi:hypothetical protein